MPSARVYFIEVYRPPYTEGTLYRIHRDTYDPDELSASLLSLTSVVGRNKDEAIARAIHGLGKKVIG